MNVGLFTDTYFPQVSGVSTSVLTLANQLEKQGHRVYIFTTTDPNVKKAQYGIADEKRVYRFNSVPFVSFKDRRVTYRGFFEAVQIAENLRLDLIHTQTEFSLGVMGKFVARQLDIPIIHTYHTLYEDYTHYFLNGRLIKTSGIALLTRSYLKNVDGVIAPSKRVNNLLKKYKIKTPIKIIPTGVQIDNYFDKEKVESIKKKLKLNNKQKIILSLGRLAYEKNIDQLIDAMPKIIETYPDAKLLIVGDGPARSQLENKVVSLNLEKQIIFVGMIDHSDTKNYYQLANLFVSTSTSETQGLTFIEAMAAQRPFVASHSEYLDELIDSKKIGTLFKDSDQLIAAIKYYLDRQELLKPNKERDKAIEAASAEHFGFEVENFYNQILKKQTIKKRHHTRQLNKSENEYVKNMLKRVTPIRLQKATRKTADRIIDISKRITSND